MKLTIDTLLKTILAEDAQTLGDLTTELEKLLPNGEWKSYKLLSHTTIINQPYIYPQPHCPYPPQYPIITWCGSGATTSGYMDATVSGSHTLTTVTQTNN